VLRLALGFAAAAALVCGCSERTYSESEVRPAFAEQGYELRPLFVGGPLVSSGRVFTVIVANSTGEAKTYFEPLEQQSSQSTYDIRQRNVIVTADNRPSPEHVRRIEAALADLSE
jgi:hypothetical protein